MHLSYLKTLVEVGGFQLCRLSRKIPGDAKVHRESISFFNEVKQNSGVDDSKSKKYEQPCGKKTIFYNFNLLDLGETLNCEGKRLCGFIEFVKLSKAR